MPFLVGADRQQKLAAITQLMSDVDVHLVANGFVPHRTGEHLHPGGRHIRKGYAGGEWTITVTQKVGTDYRPIEVLRYDSRLDNPLPTPDQLALRLAPLSRTSEVRR